MKRLLSVLLALSVLASVFMTGAATASAASSKYNAQKQQFNTQNADFNYSGDKFASFVFNGESYDLRYGKFGKKGKLLTSVQYGAEVTVKGKYVYYLDYLKSALMRIKTDGTGKKVIVQLKDYQGISYIISGSKLIYELVTYDEETMELKSDTLYIASLTGTGKKKIASIVDDSSVYYSSNYFTYKNKVYFVSKNKLRSYDIKTKKVKTVYKKFKGCVMNSMEGKNVYYFKSSFNETTGAEKMTVYRLNIGTKKVTRLTSFTAEEALYSMVTTSGKVFILTGAGDGNSFAQVKKGKLDYKTYRKKYKLAGDTIGFYQNYIATENRKSASDGSMKHIGYVRLAKVK